jgi:nucleoside-diphosphate-sugar epimerase
MKIAIIGGTSFIGENLIKHLLKKKNEIVATYYSSKKIIKNSKIIWKRLNLNKLSIKNYYKYLEFPDVVVNLAWPGIPKYQLKKHFKTSEAQKKLNYNLINNGLKNIIVLGTCYEYGIVNGPVSEKHKPRPIIPYAIAKLKLFKNILKLKKTKRFNFSWLRPFFVYGNNKNRETLYTLLKKLDQGKIKKLSVCGSLVRDFLSVDYLCKKIIEIIILNKDLGVLNVSSGKGITIRTFVRKQIKFKKNLKKIYMNANNPNYFEPQSFWGDNKKLKRYLKK